MAEAVALSGLLLLGEEAGRDAVTELARRVFGRRPPEDLRELFYERRHPMAAVFAEATALDWGDFLATWNAELDRLRATAACRAALAAVPEGSATLAVERGAGTVRDVVYGFRFAAPLPTGTLATLAHARLTPFDHELEREDLRRIEHLWPAGARETIFRMRVV
jgi:hypothetical protein